MSTSVREMRPQFAADVASDAGHEHAPGHKFFPFLLEYGELFAERRRDPKPEVFTAGLRLFALLPDAGRGTGSDRSTIAIAPLCPPNGSRWSFSPILSSASAHMLEHSRTMLLTNGANRNTRIAEFDEPPPSQ